MQESEIIAQTDNLQVRIMVLRPLEKNDWHYHNEVTDDIFCLTGTILVRVQDSDKEFRLEPGQRHKVNVRKVHQLENLENEESTYLLVQGIGKYDFNILPG